MPVAPRAGRIRTAAGSQRRRGRHRRILPQGEMLHAAISARSPVEALSSVSYGADADLPLGKVVYEFADLEVRTTPQVLAAVAEHCPDRLFVVAQDGSVTYATAARTAVALAGELRAVGVRPGDRVGVALPNGVRWCLALLAAHALGASALPLNTWQRPAETAGVLRRAQPRVVVTDTEIAARIGRTVHRSPRARLFWKRGDRPAPKQPRWTRRSPHCGTPRPARTTTPWCCSLRRGAPLRR